VFDTGEKGALGYGDFASKTAVIASRAVIAGEHQARQVRENADG